MENFFVSDTKKTGTPPPFSFKLLAIIAGCLALGACSQDQKQASVDQCENSSTLTAAIAPVISGEIAAFSVIDEPKPMPPMSFIDGEGKAASLDAFKGKVVLFNLWATWCAPCRHEMPAFDALQKAYGGDDFEIVPVSIDRGGMEKPKAFYSEIGLQHLPFYQDETMGVFNQLKKQSLAFGLPTTILIDKEGCILGSLNGPAEWAGPQAKTLIETIIKASN
jgi:thiol-disulfide isomerase/thioredoxin